ATFPLPASASASVASPPEAAGTAAPSLLLSGELGATPSPRNPTLLPLPHARRCRDTSSCQLLPWTLLLWRCGTRVAAKTPDAKPESALVSGMVCLAFVGDASARAARTIRGGWAIDVLPTKCSCKSTRCKTRVCACFREDSRCTGLCKCVGCENNPRGLVNEADSRPKKCKCKRTKCKTNMCTCFSADSRCTGLCKCEGCENTPEGLANEGDKGCTCKLIKCKTKNCGCLNRGARCTLKCSCQGCENGKGTGGADTSQDSREAQVPTSE
uniref:CRC domain-containing protein n=1 Tax=Aegilops tauschii subsp. strangulata TaxID=200361 RepID=A0A453A2D1_AEGTS